MNDKPERKEIILTTLKEQRNSLNEYSRSLSPEERLDYLFELNRVAFDIEHATPLSESRTLRVFQKKESESLEEFLRRRNREKNDSAT